MGEGKLNPRIIYNDSQGNPIPYPDISKFDDESLDYIDSRLVTTKNPLLIARYSIALWESRRKHAKYADMAIDAYVELVDFFSKLDVKRPGDFYGLRALDSIKNAYILSKRIHSQEKIDLTKGIIVDLLLTYNWESRDSFALRKYILEFMLDQKYEKEHFEPLEAVLKQLVDSSSGHQKIMVLEIKVKINRKLDTDGKNELRQIAEEYEKMMEGAIENNPLAALKFWEDAVTYFKQISNDEKVAELNQKYDELKKAASYEEFGIKIDMTKVNSALDEIVESIIDKEGEEIIQILIGDIGMLPNLNVVKEQAYKIANEHPISRLFSVTLLDEQGNVAQKFTTDEEKEQYDILNNYRLHMEIINNLLINKIFTKIITVEAFSIEELISFLEQKTWLGAIQEKQSAKDMIIKYRWIDLIKPGLIHYFTETSNSIKKEETPNYILPMDSLVLKIEGMVRDLCRANGIPTFYSKRVGGDFIMHEKDLNLILRENTLPGFTEDEMMLFKFVLIEKMGYNLRNKVAHSLMTPNDYNPTFMNHVVLIILKIAKFFKKTQ